MTGCELLVDRAGPLLRAAMVCDGRLSGLEVDRLDRPRRLGSIYLGKVERIAAGLGAAFVTLGDGASGLLAAADVRTASAGTDRPEGHGRGRGQGRAAPIGTRLRGGEAVMVQVKAEPGGAKGPTLTMDVALPGRFVIHLPLAGAVTVSRRVTTGEARARLAETIAALSGGGGWIARGAALHARPEAVAAECAALRAAWDGLVRDARAARPPARLSEGNDAARRAVIESGELSLARIVVEGEDLARRVAAWAREAAPDLAQRVETHHGAPGLFDARDLSAAIERLAERRVPLPGGGSLVFDRTEALTVIDVNGGEQTNRLQVNLDAAQEIARQIRLRNLGGIIIVDFVAMGRGADGHRLLAMLREAVADDPAATHIHGMSKLGLVEMTRTRRGPPLADLLPPPP